MRHPRRSVPIESGEGIARPWPANAQRPACREDAEGLWVNSSERKSTVGHEISSEVTRTP